MRLSRCSPHASPAACSLSYIWVDRWMDGRTNIPQEQDELAKSLRLSEVFSAALAVKVGLESTRGSSSTASRRLNVGNADDAGDEGIVAVAGSAVGSGLRPGTILAVGLHCTAIYVSQLDLFVGIVNAGELPGTRKV